ncbi:class I SAM-dependent methyltransferase [Paenibacillus planticolens]|uniref:class I SAM-dependent methyltransferase n=1 Tax=Paenibacillus planticolens TaxID=2654976 RepID=UPI001C10F032|nr:class I SAM-dependent methyltransferase [Paenibacillus planticolens]
MFVDLGCGEHKHKHFFGIDRLGGPEVDMACDINDGIPLPDQSVEFVMASRSLPYVNDLLAVMSELYRICVHKAIVCILSPYAHHFRHMSNPYLKQKFDEYTPRYFTPHFHQPPGSPHCPPVPIYTGNCIPFDFRLLKMEFFYESPFTSPLYQQDELDLLVQLQPNVVSEIMYHFVVVKKELSVDEWIWMSNQKYREPIWTESLRQSAPAIAEDAASLEPDMLFPASTAAARIRKPVKFVKPASRRQRKK